MVALANTTKKATALMLILLHTWYARLHHASVRYRTQTRDKSRRITAHP